MEHIRSSNTEFSIGVSLPGAGLVPSAVASCETKKKLDFRKESECSWVKGDLRVLCSRSSYNAALQSFTLLNTGVPGSRHKCSHDLEHEDAIIVT